MLNLLEKKAVLQVRANLKELTVSEYEWCLRDLLRDMINVDEKLKDKLIERAVYVYKKQLKKLDTAKELIDAVLICSDVRLDVPEVDNEPVE